MATPQILELAATISHSTGMLNEILTAKGHPTPSFAEDAPRSLPKEAVAAQDAILDATAELHELLLDPLGLLFRNGGHTNNVSLQAISRFNLASKVPAGGQVSFANLAEAAGLTEPTTRCLLRHAMSLRVFHEPEPGMVAHTQASKLLTKETFDSWLRTGTHEMWPAATKLVDALQKWPASEDSSETGFALANNTKASIYDIISADPVRAQRFAGAMKAYTNSPEYDLAHFVDQYNWKSLGSAKVVDIGGAQGHAGIALAKQFPSLSLIIQDFPSIMEGAEAGVPEELKDRVNFMGYEFFEKQTVQADVYYYHWVFHNWPDKYAVQILRALIPALKPNAIIIINDTVMPQPGSIAQWREKDLSCELKRERYGAVDLVMQAIFNSHERDIEE